MLVKAGQGDSMCKVSGRRESGPFRACNQFAEGRGGEGRRGEQGSVRLSLEPNQAELWSG